MGASGDARQCANATLAPQASSLAIRNPSTQHFPGSRLRQIKQALLSDTCGFSPHSAIGDTQDCAYRHASQCSGGAGREVNQCRMPTGHKNLPKFQHRRTGNERRCDEGWGPLSLENDRDTNTDDEIGQSVLDLPWQGLGPNHKARGKPGRGQQDGCVC